MISDDDFVRLFQERAGLNPDGWPGRDTLAVLDQVLPPRRSPALTEAADDVPADYFPMLAQIESGNRPYIKASSSSASGLYQFIRSTWEAEGGVWGTDMTKAFGGLRPSEAEQLARAKTFTAKNAHYLKRKGIPINRASLYAAHFLGALTATNVIGADVDASAEALAGAAATNANPSILRGKTVGQFLTWLHGKTGQWAR
ncbi:MAG: hypothetical protein U9R07_15680 [Pseudomonadota bacterium]|nr:hypothetical protein [Pseudomonadota bacterium]